MAHQLSISGWTRRHVSGIILNGGESTRLGRDKAALVIDGRTLLEHAVEKLARCFDEILLVGRPDAFPDHPAITQAIPDIIPDAGPLGGIYTGLLAMSRPYGLFVACDMPCLDARVIRRQVEVLRASNVDAVVPCWNGYREPLHAIYSRACLLAVRRRLASGDYRIRGFFDEVRVLLWNVLAEGISTRPFTNVNTRSDLAAVVGETV